MSSATMSEVKFALLSRYVRTSRGWAGVEPGLCLGMALAAQGQWDEAEAAFTAARELTPANEPANRARLGGMAGNALLAAGKAEAALALLDQAHGEALGAKDPRLAGEISIDRARALVALKRDGDAAAALATARANAADNGQGWLLSATLSRRQGKLAEAQQQIQVAAELLPLDPEVGLEAGVIAVLAGNDGAARRSWLSVIKAAPGSETARTAQSYLDQLGPDPAPSGR
ncbi:MAG: tetratricopeptide repeat protein [Novosphingobium sp.]|uniref:tetratricopeptide repeat protein n=1 Tax=Novosphingobium sp. TaxID=1874826 RepID=UPI00391C8C7F